MSRSRKVLLVMVALALLADFLPVTREELSWWRAESLGHPRNYLLYLSDWPKGRHAIDARIRFKQGQWAETKRARIQQASAPNSEAEAAYRKELGRRREFLSWNRASVSNTVESYKSYIQQYPDGHYAAQARHLIETLSQASSPTGNPAPP